MVLVLAEPAPFLPWFTRPFVRRERRDGGPFMAIQEVVKRILVVFLVDVDAEGIDEDDLVLVNAQALALRAAGVGWRRPAVRSLHGDRVVAKYNAWPASPSSRAT